MENLFSFLRFSIKCFMSRIVFTFLLDPVIYLRSILYINNAYNQSNNMTGYVEYKIT